MRLSVRVKLSALMIIMVGAAILITGFLKYQQEKVEAVEMLGDRLQAIAQTAAPLIDGDKHQWISEPEDARGPFFEEIREQLLEIKEENHLATAVYTLRSQALGPGPRRPTALSPFSLLGGTYKTQFVVMTNDPPFVGQDYILIDEMRSAFQGIPTKTRIYENLIGRWISAFGPIKRSDGTIDGIVGVDYRVDVFLDELAKRRAHILRYSVIGALVAVVAALLFAQMIFVGPVNTLARATQALKAGRYDEPILGPDDKIPLYWRLKRLMPDEVEHLAETLEEMRQALKEKLGELESVNRDLEARGRELTEATNFLNNVLEASTEYAIIALDLDGTILTFNEGARRTYGYSPDTMVGRQSLAALLPDGDREAGTSKEVLAKAKVEGRFEGEMERIDASGRSFPTHVALTLRRDDEGRPLGFVEVSRDITERVKMERQLQNYADNLQQMVIERTEQLRIARDKYKTLFDTVPVGIFQCTIDGTFTSINPTGAQILGYSMPEEVEGKLTASRLYHNPADQARLEAAFAQSDQPVVEDYLLQLKRRDDTPFWAEVSCRLLIDEAGEPTVMEGVMRDVTERIILQRQIQEHAEHLERLARELEMKNKELLIQNERVLEANRLKSQFLANMSHELRTPMNAIIGFTELVLEDARVALSTRQQDNLRKVSKNSNQLLNLINDILDLSKIEAGRMDVVPERVDLGEVVEAAWTTVQPLLKGKEVEVETELDASVPSLFTDKHKLRQVLVNLLSNAIKFTPSGSVRLVARSGDGRLELLVVDTGMGIAQEDKEIIFDEFRQIDGTSTREVGGTGLGLAITKKLVELLGGTIKVESEVGKGSTFIVEVPVTVLPRTAAAIEAEAARTAEELGSEDHPPG
jgi:PAS domain S-box-containing protein